MWKSTVAGQALHFRLAGINNQNFIMRDEETGSWWQQVSGKAILGSMKGQQLPMVECDEVTYLVWKKERPSGLTLLPDPRFKEKYVPADWELRMASNPTVTPTNSSDPLKPRDLVVGLSYQGVSKAYPMGRLLKFNPVVDVLGSKPILIVVGSDGRSVRSFERTVDGRTLDLFRKTESGVLRMFDSQTGSEWDFSGKATSGEYAGKSLPRVTAFKDYWFDWKMYHPGTLVFAR